MINEVPLTLSPSDAPQSYLWYGPPGSGKSFAAAHTPHKRKLFLDIDQKLESMENLPPAVRERIHVWKPTATLSESGRIAVIRVERTEGRDSKSKVTGTVDYVPKDPKGYLETVDFINELLKRAEAGTFNYDLVVLDSLTSLNDHIESVIKSHHKTAVFSLPLWGVLKSNYQEFFGGWHSLPCDRIIIAHSKTIQDEATKEVNVLPMMDGQMAEKLPKDFNEVYYFTGRSREATYSVQTASTRKIIARTTKGFDLEVPVEVMLGRMGHLP